MQSPLQEKMAGLSSGTFLFLGIAMVVLGIIAIFSAFAFTLGTVMVLGGLLVVAAIAEFIHAGTAAKQKHAFGWNIVSGVVYLITGLIMLFRPLLGALSLTLIIAGFLIISGVIRLINAYRHRADHNWGWLVVSGIIDIALGILIAAHWPATALWVIGLFVGIELIIYGASWLALAAAMGKDLTQTPAAS